MITKEKIEIFAHYHGDVDAFGHGSSSHNRMMDGDEFYLIDGLIQDIIIINKNLTSEEFENSAERKLKDNCDNENTIIELKKLALKTL